jgi:hypothetical protein
MWGRARKSEATAETWQAQPLKDAVRATRVEMAEQSGVVVDLRDAELARLELLNDALDSLFSEIPLGFDLFDRGISRGDTPRLWIDPIAHVAMGRDKRRYRFVQDTRHGRKVLAEGNEIAPIVEAITHYVAARMIEREKALAADASPLHTRLHGRHPLRRGRALRAFLCGLIAGAAALFAALWIVAARLH